MPVFASIFAIVTLAGAVAAMTLRSLVHCALALTIAFAGLAALFIGLGAEFAGLAQLLVYVGAVAILIVFVILLTPASENAFAPRRAELAGVTGISLAIGVFAVFAWAILHSASVKTMTEGTRPQVTVKQIGEVMMHWYTLPLEVLGLMLTAALIGAVILAGKETPTAR